MPGSKQTHLSLVNAKEHYICQRLAVVDTPYIQNASFALIQTDILFIARLFSLRMAAGNQTHNYGPPVVTTSQWKTTGCWL